MSTVNSVSSAASSATTTATDTVANPSQTLNQNDFLQLLVAQIQYQDPMNPQSDTQMAAQMAQFTALQQSSQMSSSLSMMQANSLVGSTVSVLVTPGSNDIVTGVVTGVTVASGSPQILLSTDSSSQSTPYNLSQVQTVTPGSSAAATSTTPTTTPTTPTGN